MTRCHALIKSARNGSRRCMNTTKSAIGYCSKHSKYLQHIEPSDLLLIQTKCESLQLLKYHHPYTISYLPAYCFLLLELLDATVKRCQEHLDKIIILQRSIKRYLHNRVAILHGPAWLNPSICNNTTDFYTLDELTDIPADQLFSYTDADDGFIYGFHINTFTKYIESGDSRNPYNRKPIPDDVIARAGKLSKYLSNLNEEEFMEETDETIQGRALRYFQKYRMLGFQLEEDWILHANIEQLKTYYIIIINELVNKLLGNYDERTFYIKYTDEYTHMNLANVRDSEDRNIILLALLELFNKFITIGETEGDRTTGAIFILTSLANSIPQIQTMNTWL